MTVDAAEVQAFRAACGRFLQEYMEELMKRTGLGPLENTGHSHQTLLVDHDSGKAMMLTARFDFGDLVDQNDVRELMQAALVTPGGVENT